MSDLDKSKPRCPGCGNPYDVKIPNGEFIISDVNEGDSYCQEVGYYHIHRSSKIGRNVR